jgi:hypothetical protein
MELFSWLAGSAVMRLGTGRHFITPDEDGGLPPWLGPFFEGY